MFNTVLFSSNSDEWSTPQFLFNYYNKRFNFDLDVCATKFNNKCRDYLTIVDDSLTCDWYGSVWCNPPYSKISAFVDKAIQQINNLNVKRVVLLIPSRTDTKYFSKAFSYCSEIAFIKGRLHFNDSKNSAPFPSCVLLLERSSQVFPNCFILDQKILNNFS